MASEKQVILKVGRADSVARRHPWIFTGAIDRVLGQPQAGDQVIVRSAEGVALGVGAYSPRSQIQVRLWSFDPEQKIDRDFLANRLAQAFAGRRAQLEQPDGGCRLVNAESDFLPGLIIDRYAGCLVLQISSAGIDRLRPLLIELLPELLPEIRTIYERSDLDVRAKEGLEPRVGKLWGSELPPHSMIREGQNRFIVDVRSGHKTGFYLDQVLSRQALARHAPGREVLNAFSYTGAFAVVALRAGATKVTNVDTSAPALALASENASLNELDLDKLENVEGNVFSVLRGWRAEGRLFDLIVLDPPKFVDSKAHLDRAARGYKDINLLAFQLLRPRGLLLTFSCSGLMPAELFQKIVADAALDARRNVQLIERLGPPADHPLAMSFPEGHYLKGLVCRAE